MITTRIRSIKLLLRVITVACGGFSTAVLTTESVFAQTLVQSQTVQEPGSVDVVFNTTAGKSYRIEHSMDLQSWAFYPDSLYGLGQTVRYHVYDAPIAVQGPSSPPSNEPRAAEFFYFHVTAFNDGSAVAAWRGLDGSAQKAYLPSFNLVYQGKLMSEMIAGTRVPATGLPYRLDVWSWGYTVKHPAVVNIQSSPAEAGTLAKLTSQYQWVFDTMKARVDYRSANPGPPPSPPKLFDDRGQPLKQFFRVREYTTDSNMDGVADHLQFITGGNPFNMDIDGDGIPNGYDKDIFPNDLRLRNVLINEALFANEFTNTDDESTPQDWIELYNPTNAGINIGGWNLSDSNSNLAKWTIPAGTTIGSGQFLIVWASGKLRTGGPPYHATFSLSNGSAGPPVGNTEPVRLSRTSVPVTHAVCAANVATLTTVSPHNLSVGSPILVDLSNGAYNGAFAVIGVPTATTLSYAKSGAAISAAIVTGTVAASAGQLFVDAYRPLTAPTTSLTYCPVDTAYGCYPTGSGLQFGYLILPTPGAHNVQGALGITEPPTFGTGSAPGLYEATTITATLVPPASGGSVHFTTNSAHPTRYSELYSGPITATRTKVVRAIAAKDGYLPSASITRSYLFKEDILGTAPSGSEPQDSQGKRDAQGNFKGLLYGYPERTEQEDPDFPMLYGVHGQTVAQKKAQLSLELSGAPVVSIVSTVPDLFDLESAGLLPNSGQTDGGLGDPRSRAWQRLCSFEFIEANKSNWKQVNACLLVTGGSSIYQRVTRKHNLRLKFDTTHGEKSFIYTPGLFADLSGVSEFKSLHLKNPTHDSWANTWLEYGGTAGSLNGSGTYSVGDVATYCNEAWAKATHQAMGHDAPRFRWAHLFLNGIYWGPHQLTERVDQDYMRSHASSNADFDVIKQGGVLVGGEILVGDVLSGDRLAWDAFIAACKAVETASAPEKPARYSEVEALLHVDNYIDYLIVNLYCQNDDWPGNNWRAARNKTAVGSRWSFLIWDAEWAFRPGEQTAGLGGRLDLPSRLTAGGAITPHMSLVSHQPYRTRFSERLKKHFFVTAGDPSSGCMAIVGGVDRNVTRFQAEMDRFDDVITCESVRWGYMEKTIPYAQADPTYLSAKPFGDWVRNTNYTKNTWLPARRAYFLSVMQTNGLYVP
jgi:CotH kinase protein/Lamin Tail Domain/Chitobiase/beta-hexosaminidase C-terminal domain